MTASGRRTPDAVRIAEIENTRGAGQIMPPGERQFLEFQHYAQFGSANTAPHPPRLTLQLSPKVQYNLATPLFALAAVAVRSPSISR